MPGNPISAIHDVPSSFSTYLPLLPLRSSPPLPTIRRKIFFHRKTRNALAFMNIKFGSIAQFYISFVIACRPSFHPHHVQVGLRLTSNVYHACQKIFFNP